MSYVGHLIVVAAVYAILAVSLELLVGRIGLLSVAHAVFFGIGAYTSAVLVSGYGLSFLPSAGTGILIAIVASLAVSLASMHLHEDYFVIGTLALQAIAFSVFNNWMEVTRGPLGIPGIPAPVLLGWRVDTQLEFGLLALFCVGLACLSVWCIMGSPLGRVLLAVREDEIFAQSVGKATQTAKVTCCAIGSALASTAGSLYAHFITYIDPTHFTVGESILILSMVIIGGAGRTWGAVLGACVLVALPEALRFVGLPIAAAANLRQVIYGSLLVAMMLVRPQGILGRYAFGR